MNFISFIAGIDYINFFYIRICIKLISVADPFLKTETLIT